MNLRQRLKRAYKHGILCAAKNPRNELLMQLGYIVTVVAEIIFLWRTTKTAIIYTYMIGMHIFIMYIFFEKEILHKNYIHEIVFYYKWHYTWNDYGVYKISNCFNITFSSNGRKYIYNSTKPNYYRYYWVDSKWQ